MTSRARRKYFQVELQSIDALALYREVAFVRDPFHQLFQANREDRVDSLRDIAPDEFHCSEYNTQIFQQLEQGAYWWR